MTCAATAVIVHSYESGQHKGKIGGNSALPGEAKSLVVDRGELTPQVSRFCWQFVSLAEARVAEIDSIEIIQVSPPMLQPPLSFDPKTTRVFGAVYWTPPAAGSIEFPKGSGQQMPGVRWEYKAKLKLQGGPMVDIDPDIVIKG